MKTFLIFISSLLPFCAKEKTIVNRSDNIVKIENEAYAPDLNECNEKGKMYDKKQKDLKILLNYKNKGETLNQITTLKIIYSYCPEEQFSYELGILLFMEKDYVGARKYLSKVEFAYESDVVLLYNLSQIFSMLGNKEKSLRFLERALKNGFMDIDKIKTDPQLNWLRSEIDLDNWLKEIRDVAQIKKNFPGYYEIPGSSYPWYFIVCKNHTYMEIEGMRISEESDGNNPQYKTTIFRGKWSFKNNILQIAGIEYCENQKKGKKLSCKRYKKGAKVYQISPYSEKVGVFWGSKKSDNNDKKSDKKCNLNLSGEKIFKVF